MQFFYSRQHLVQADAVGVVHRPAAEGREAVAVEVDDVDVAGALGNAFLENLRALVDQREDAALDDVLLVQRLPLDALFPRRGFQHGREVGILLRGAVAGFVAVVAGTGLLPEHAGGAELVRDGGEIQVRRQRRALALADRLADVEAGQVAHGERSHGHAEVAQRTIDLLRRGTFLQQEFGLAAVLEDHAVADEAVADADHHRDLLQLLADRHGGGEHFIAGPLATHHFEQTHDVGRAEEMQADHILGAFGEAGDGVQVQRRGVGGEDRTRLAHRIQLLEDLLLDAHLLEHGLDHHVGIGQGAVVGDAGDQREALRHRILGQAAALDARRVGFAGTLQAALQRLVIDFQQLHRHPGVGEAQGDADAHGAAADHRGGPDRAGGDVGW